MSGDKRTRLKQWLESGEAQLHPLTFPQRELWEASSVPIGDPANHICCLIHVRGLLTQRDAEAALQRVVNRQEVLRLSFLPGKDQPLQMVRTSSGPNVQFHELSATGGAPEAIEELAQEIFLQPFDVAQGPLYRAEILRRAPDDHVFVFCIHHAIADGWTLGVFVQDLFDAYVRVVTGASEAPPALPLAYTAWGAAERAFWRTEELKARAEFWKAALANAPRLWPSQPGPAALCRSVSSIPAGLAAAIRELARRSGATLFSTLLAAFRWALAEWTGAEDVVVGTPVANRGRAAIRETMGYCSGIVPLRARANRDRPFLDCLSELHETTVQYFANAMPFAELVRVLGDRPVPGYHPVFQVRFALQNHPVPDITLPALSTKLRMRSTGTARFDLGCEITEDDDALEVVWLARPAVISQAGIHEIDRIFQSVLAAVCRSPESKLSMRTS